jgi:hypothetical protein
LSLKYYTNIHSFFLYPNLTIRKETKTSHSPSLFPSEETQNKIIFFKIEILILGIVAVECGGSYAFSSTVHDLPSPSP